MCLDPAMDMVPTADCPRTRSVDDDMTLWSVPASVGTPGCGGRAVQVWRPPTRRRGLVPQHAGGTTSLAAATLHVAVDPS